MICLKCKRVTGFSQYNLKGLVGSFAWTVQPPECPAALPKSYDDVIDTPVSTVSERAPWPSPHDDLKHRTHSRPRPCCCSF